MKGEKSSPADFYRQIPDLDWETAIEAIGGLKELYDKLFRQVVRRLPDNIRAMDKDIAPDGNLLSFAIMTHGLKSSLRQIGYRKLAKLSETLETAAKDENAEVCRLLYDDFKQGLAHFYEQASALIRDADGKENPGTIEKNLSEFKALFERAKAASEEYDTLAVTDILSPLSGYRFGGQADEELSKALSELEVFQPLEALVHIEKLLDMCGENPA